MRMTRIAGLMSLGGLLMAGLLMGSAQAETTKAPSATPENVCLRPVDVDRTTAPNDKTLLFYMKNGKVWRNALVAYCPMLSVNGFSYAPTPPNEICGSMQTIRVLRSGSVCLLGPFTQDTPTGSP
ncbi:MAG: hypothetical protein HY243_03985 [Proteobacteria bacterium]|nr:hypothetical protein [Pseudomonadota bacterium]